MADGFDECHKKRLVSKPGVCDPLAHSLYRMKELLRKEAWGSVACFFQYLHPSDPDVNHVDLLTSLLIVYCFLVDFFSFHIVLFLSICVLLLPLVYRCMFVCLHVSACVSVHVYTDKLLPQ